MLKIRIRKIFAALEKHTMGKIGVIKEIDRLGRIVIPKDLRDRYFIENRVEVVATEDGILVRNPEYRLERIKAADEP